MITRGSEVEVQLVALAFEGHAIARHEGFVLFVRGGVPGDIVRARIIKKKRNHAEAEIAEVIHQSPSRVPAACAHFGLCGGCKWQHIAYAEQLRAKEQHVIDAFERIGGFRSIPIAPIVGAADPFFYRNKIEFSFSRRRWLTVEELQSGQDFSGEFGLGFHIPNRYEKVLNIEECWLHSSLSNQILNAVRTFCQERRLSVCSTKTHEGYLRHLVIRDGKRTGEVMVNLVTTTHEPDLMQALSTKLTSQFPAITTFVNNITARKSMVAQGDQEVVYSGSGTITERLGKYRFQVSANSFFQTNSTQAERLYEIARTAGELKPSDTVFDLYCGTGTIAIYISDAVSSVIGIDLIPSAIEDAHRNAELNSVTNCRFVLGDLKDLLTRERNWMSDHPDVVILDPPRSGLHPQVVEEVAALSPGRIVYVSCNPTTQARDVKMFAETGYELVGLQPVDMFPHTFHVENVAALRRRGA